MPRVCSVCTHSELAEINRLLLVHGGSKRTTAGRFGLKDASVQRHRRNCLGQKPREQRAPKGNEPGANSIAEGNDPRAGRFANASGEITSPKHLLDRLRSLFRLGDLLEEAYERRDIDACVKLAREYRAAAESYAKVAGWLVDGGAGSTFVDQRRQIVNVLGRLSEDELLALAHGEHVSALPAAPNEPGAIEPAVTPPAA